MADPLGIFDSNLDEACRCPDLWAAFAADCPAHAVHRAILSSEAARRALEESEARLAGALLNLVNDHFRHDPPGPVPGPVTGVCFSCGNTGERYHGPGADGPVWDGECGCDRPFCGGCGERWPCDDIKVIAEAFRVEIPEEDE